MEVTFRSLSENAPDAAWKKVFTTGWPGWKAWLRARQSADAPTLAASEKALRLHMPEFAPVWEKLVEHVGADEEAARFLTFWTPPRYLGQCANAVSGGDTPTLVRNYDLDPRLNEATMLKTAWSGREVMGMVEGLAGLADGINDDGLAVSLTYGGRSKAIGEGFGIPLTIRYLLETCSDVAEAEETLRRLPHHMSYNLTLLDREGAHITAMVAPDREIVISDARFITNHQGNVEDEKHAAFCNTVGRLNHLHEADVGNLDRKELIETFQSKPMYNTQFDAGFGTVYTAAYTPARGEATLIWPGQPEWSQSFDDFREETRTTTYAAPAWKADAGDESEADWIRFVPPEARRWVLLGVENTA